MAFMHLPGYTHVKLLPVLLNIALLGLNEPDNFANRWLEHNFQIFSTPRSAGNPL